MSAQNSRDIPVVWTSAFCCLHLLGSSGNRCVEFAFLDNRTDIVPWLPELVWGVAAESSPCVYSCSLLLTITSTCPFSDQGGKVLEHGLATHSEEDTLSRLSGIKKCFTVFTLKLAFHKGLPSRQTLMSFLLKE